MPYKVIYLDSCATAPVFPEVVKVMLPFFTKQYGNPSSPHQSGEEARLAVEQARKDIALELGCKAYELVFTSGGTEANALAFFGLAGAVEHEKKRKIVISAIEHASVMDVCNALRKRGYQIVEAGVDSEGRVRWEELEKAADYETLLVSVIHGNNEVGTLQDIRRIGALCRKRGALFHTDAVQSFGKEMIRVHDWNIDVLSASSHKLGGPKGSGVLYVRSGIALQPLMPGSQEAGRRGGTENVAGIAGFAKALEVMRKKRGGVVVLQKMLIEGVEKIGGRITGSREQRLEDHVSAVFPGVDAEMLVLRLSQKGVYCSTKSACLTKGAKESYVLRALGFSTEEMRGAVRFGLHPGLAKMDIARALKILKKCLNEQ